MFKKQTFDWNTTDPYRGRAVAKMNNGFNMCEFQARWHWEIMWLPRQPSLNKQVFKTHNSPHLTVLVFASQCFHHKWELFSYFTGGNGKCSCKLMPREAALRPLPCRSKQVYNQHSSHFPSQMEHKYIGTENHKWLSTEQPVSKSGPGV